VPRQAENSACSKHCGHAQPWIRGMGYTVATPCLVFLTGGTYFEGVVGHLLGASFSGGRLLEVGPSWGCPLALVVFRQPTA